MGRGRSPVVVLVAADGDGAAVQSKLGLTVSSQRFALTGVLSISRCYWTEVTLARERVQLCWAATSHTSMSQSMQTTVPEHPGL